MHGRWKVLRKVIGKEDNISSTSGGSNYDSLFVRTVAFPVQVSFWIKEVILLIAPCGTSVPCQLRPVVRRHGRGVLWTGGDPCMTGCLECPLASPVFAQSWSQTATDGAWYSTTALPSGRDRPRCLCVLRLSGSEPKTRRTRNVATSLSSISLPVGARWLCGARPLSTANDAGGRNTLICPTSNRTYKRYLRCSRAEV